MVRGYGWHGLAGYYRWTLPRICGDSNNTSNNFDEMPHRRSILCVKV